MCIGFARNRAAPPLTKQNRKLDALQAPHIHLQEGGDLGTNEQKLDTRTTPHDNELPHPRGPLNHDGQQRR